MSRRVKVPLVSLVSLGVGVICLMVLVPDARTVAADQLVAAKAQAFRPHPPTHTRPFIAGATDLDAIPDQVAYRMFLRMLMTPKIGPLGAKMHRSYIRHVLRSGAVLADDRHIGRRNEDCAAHKDAEPPPEAIDVVLRFVESYEGELRAIDRDRRALRERGDVPGAQAMAKERDALVQKVVDRLPSFVGDKTANKIDLYVRLHFKKTIKIFLDPESRRHTDEGTVVARSSLPRSGVRS